MLNWNVADDNKSGDGSATMYLNFDDLSAYLAPNSVPPVESLLNEKTSATGSLACQVRDIWNSEMSFVESGFDVAVGTQAAPFKLIEECDFR